MKTENAIIESVFIRIRDEAFEVGVLLAYETGSQVFSCSMSIPEKPTFTDFLGVSYFMHRVLEVTGVKDWDSVKGQAVRVDADQNRVKAIGHIIKDVWFDPGEELKKSADVHAAGAEK